jgi:hypothetical protein
MERAIPHDLVACCESDLACHRALVDASGNLMLKNLIGTIEAALRASFLLTARLMENQAKTLSVHKAVLESVRVRDTAGARSAMNRLLDLAEEAYRWLARGRCQVVETTSGFFTLSHPSTSVLSAGSAHGGTMSLSRARPNFRRRRPSAPDLGRIPTTARSALLEGHAINKFHRSPFGLGSKLPIKGAE